ncbi:MAG TPA: nuclear transport factor 2 family protein [Caulobacteraceae bacterium]|nr:nuclear transport factor 2 family protein [Caulobacteraceae bacterium]
MANSDPRSDETARLMERFNTAFLEHSPEKLDALVADDCIIENTVARPNGDRYVGKPACVGLWTSIASNQQARFEPESIDAYGDRALIFWRFVWGAGPDDSVRGVNIMRVRDGLIVEALGYVKGPG